MTAKEAKFGYLIKDNIYFMIQMDDLGIRRKYTGFFQLIEIIKVLVNDGVMVSSFSREVYPVVAAHYGKSVCTIERNIRNLIDKCWSKEMMEKLNVYFPENKKPSCQQFIYMCKNYVSKQRIV